MALEALENKISPPSPMESVPWEDKANRRRHYYSSARSRSSKCTAFFAASLDKKCRSSKAAPQKCPKRTDRCRQVTSCRPGSFMGIGVGRRLCLLLNRLKPLLNACAAYHNKTNRDTGAGDLVNQMNFQVIVFYSGNCSRAAVVSYASYSALATGDSAILYWSKSKKRCCGSAKPEEETRWGSLSRGSVKSFVSKETGLRFPGSG